MDEVEVEQRIYALERDLRISLQKIVEMEHEIKGLRQELSSIPRVQNR